MLPMPFGDDKNVSGGSLFPPSSSSPSYFSDTSDEDMEDFMCAVVTVIFKVWKSVSLL
jgi:hypothetical protein